MPTRFRRHSLYVALCAIGAICPTSAVQPDQPVLLTGEHALNLAFVYDWEPQVGQQRLVRYLPTKAQFDDAGLLRGLDDAGAITWDAEVFDPGNDGAIAWGRWSRNLIGGTGLRGGHSITGAEGVRNSLYYVAGTPPSDRAMAELAASGGTATFSLYGGNTGPTTGEGGGVSITLLVAGKVEVNAVEQSVDVDLSFQEASGLYAFQARDLPLKGGGFAATAPVPTTGVLCIPACATELSGFLAGDGARRVGVAFSVHNPALSKYINGIAAFQRP